MAGLGDDGSFSDDEFDALASDDLLALEDQAVQRLPGPASANQNGLPEQHPAYIGQQGFDALGTNGYNGSANGFDDYELQEEVREATPPNVRRAPLSAKPAISQSTRAVGEASQREKWQLDRFGPSATVKTHAQARNGVSLPHRHFDTVSQGFSQASPIQPPSRSQNLVDSSGEVERLQVELRRVCSEPRLTKMKLITCIGPAGEGGTSKCRKGSE